MNTLLMSDVESLILERQLDKGTEDQYRRTIRFYSAWLGHTATRQDLDEKLINAWLREVEQTRSASTALYRKRGLTAVWNFLADQSLVRSYNGNRLRRISVRLAPPQAWSIPNVRALLAGAATLTGHMHCGILASDLMRAWVLVAYETGLRPSDLRLLTQADIKGETVYLCQHKTGKPHVATLSSDAVAALKKLDRDGTTLLFGFSRSTMRAWEVQLFAAAGEFGFTRRHGQSIGTLRKTHGTEICRTQGIAAAARSLGHVGGTIIAERHYVEPSAIARPMPPPRLYG